jgi:uncharacterized caspase-like protein
VSNLLRILLGQSKKHFNAMSIALRCLLLCVTLGGIFNTHAADNSNLQVGSFDNKRVALVIGNSAYPGPAALQNPANDASDIADKLNKLGFVVTLKKDVKLREMLRTLTEFGDKVTEGSEVLFFYAGHGMQVKGRNYLLPVDAQIRTESSVSSEAVDVDQLLDKLSRARLSMVILDACRNNPFERRFRGGGQGLAQINAPTGTLIAYATAPGKVAADGDGRNGLYTQELLKAMDVPGIKVEDVFKRVRGNVVKLSGDAQTPWESSSLTGDFYFIFTGPSTVNVKQLATDPESEAWKAAESANTEATYRAYLSAYPKGRYKAAADIKLLAFKTQEIPQTDKSAIPATAIRNETPTKENRTFKDCPECPEMVMIPAGQFRMGSINDATTMPTHTVRISKPFAMSVMRIIERQWREIMQRQSPSTNYACNTNTLDCEVVNVSWKEAVEFTNKLSERTGQSYRLPSEAEWEYACRAGSEHKYCRTDEASKTKYVFDSSISKNNHSIQDIPANGWGLKQIGDGGVKEWAGDCWKENYEGAPDDGASRKGKVDCSHSVRGAEGTYWRAGNFGIAGIRVAR